MTDPDDNAPGVYLSEQEADALAVWLGDRGDLRAYALGIVGCPEPERPAALDRLAALWARRERFKTENLLRPESDHAGVDE